MSDFSNKSVVVTGGGSGIGEACAKMFAAKGASVLIADVDKDGGKRVVDEIEAAGGVAAFQYVNVADAESVEAGVEAAVEQFGGLDVMVNNAGIGGPLATTGEYPLDGWQKVIDINLSGVFYGTKYAINAMLASGGGAIVNIASILGSVGIANSIAYVAAKHGVIGLTKSAALEYSAQGIRVNSVGPGFIRTPLLENSLDEDTMTMLVGAHPIGRLGVANDVAEMVVWLSSDAAAFCTGTYYPVDGGYLSQ